MGDFRDYMFLRWKYDRMAQLRDRGEHYDPMELAITGSQLVRLVVEFESSEKTEGRSLG